MKLYNKNKYKFLFLPTIPLFSTDIISFFKQKLNTESKLSLFFEQKLPKIFYVGKTKGSFSFSSGDAACMTAVSLDIHVTTDTLLDYLETFKKIDPELKYNLDCLDKNYNTSELDFLFILDFSLLYKEFEKELFRKVLKETVDYLEVIDTTRVHSSPYTRLCRTEIILTQQELEWKLSDYIPFVPNNPELWDKIYKFNKEYYEVTIRTTDVVDEPVLEKREVDKIMLILNEAQ